MMMHYLGRRIGNKMLKLDIDWRNEFDSIHYWFYSEISSTVF